MNKGRVGDKITRRKRAIWSVLDGSSQSWRGRQNFTERRCLRVHSSSFSFLPLIPRTSSCSTTTPSPVVFAGLQDLRKLLRQAASPFHHPSHTHTNRFDFQPPYPRHSDDTGSLCIRPTSKNLLSRRRPSCSPFVYREDLVAPTSPTTEDLHVAETPRQLV